MQSRTGVLLRILLLLVALPSPAGAQTAWVTDNLQLGLHRAPDTSDRAFRTLESGQELDVLSRNRYYAQVRLPDSTVGYVKAAYLVDEKPAVLRVAETAAENARLTEELQRVKNQFAGPAATIDALEQQVAEQKSAIEEGLARIGELTEENERYARRQERYEFSLPMSWVGAALSVSLFAGFLGGMWWLDYRSRKRHGGLRIY
ncbi:MAG TPA: TIGR04211 family SH3 domain-containing protein [Woeseiaceae bacterium]|nr:TIGR04211 family SH3 domain-containing protein [Woeseiaceae bacterium]